MLCSSGIMKLYFNTSTEKHFWGWKQTKSVMFSSVKLNHVCSPHRRSVQRGFHPVTVTHHPWTWDKCERPCAALWQEAPHFFYSHTPHLLWVRLKQLVWRWHFHCCVAHGSDISAWLLLSYVVCFIREAGVLTYILIQYLLVLYYLAVAAYIYLTQ